MTPTLTLLGKPDCHLCHEMADVVRSVIADAAQLEEQDVRSRPEWARYRLEIPVLLLGEEEVVRHRVTAADLKTRLRSLGVAVSG
jgi:hypothetical protein